MYFYGGACSQLPVLTRETPSFENAHEEMGGSVCSGKVQGAQLTVPIFSEVRHECFYREQVEGETQRYGGLRSYTVLDI